MGDPNLREMIYWIFNKLKSGNFGNSGVGSGGITQTQLDTALENKVDKVLGKTLSSNDYTNDDKSKVGEIINKLDKGTYTGTAKDLADSIEQIKTNSRSVSWADIQNKPRVSVSLTENSTSRTYTIGLTGANSSSEKLILPKVVSWNDVTDKPSLDFLPLSGGTVNGGVNLNGELLFNDKVKAVARPNGNSIAFGNKPFNDLVYGEFKGIKIWGHDSNDKIVLAGGGVKNLSDFNFTKASFLLSELKTFKNRETGAYYVNTGGGSGILLSFFAGGSTSSLEFYKENWYPQTRIGVRNTVDGSRFNDDNGGFRNLAWYDDVIRIGGEIGANWTATRDSQNNTIFIVANCNVELNQLEHRSSMSFRKVFGDGNVTVTCSGKQIIYTSGNLFNGGDGSTATVSIWNNKCYIDIRNI